MKPGELVMVTWRDAHSAGGWHDEDDVRRYLEQDCIVEQVGFIVDDADPTFITLASRRDISSMADPNYMTQVGLVARIPRSCILKGPRRLS